MAKHQSHMSFSVGLAFTYVIAGWFFFDIKGEYLLLSWLLIVITGLLPDIDEHNSPPARELGGLIAVLVPFTLIEKFPGLREGGITRLSLVVICGYLVARIGVNRIIKILTVHRGVVHSIPASLIILTGTYLLFSDLEFFDRAYVSLAAFLGYFFHLLLDAYSNVDIVGSVFGKSESQAGALSLKGNTVFSTIIIYGILFWLSYHAYLDLSTQFPRA
jgi:hypothetical protein